MELPIGSDRRYPFFNNSCVPGFQIFLVNRGLRIFFTVCIREACHPVEGQWANMVGRCGIDIHILPKTIHKDQIISDPTFGQRRQVVNLKECLNFVTRTSNDKHVIQFQEQGLYVTVSCVGTHMRFPLRNLRLF